MKKVMLVAIVALVTLGFMGCSSERKETLLKTTEIRNEQMFVKEAERVLVLERIQAINAKDGFATISAGKEVIYKKVEYPSLTGGVVRVYGGYVRVSITPNSSQAGQGPFYEANAYFEVRFDEEQDGLRFDHDNFIFEGRYVVGAHVAKQEETKKRILTDMEKVEVFAKQARKGVSRT